MTEDQIFILDASAGTGKTYNLSKRYLKLLLENFSSKQSLKEIIAITFTNKACFEMKQRILEMLKKISLDQLKEEEKKDIFSELKDFDQKKLRDYASLIIEEILKNYHYFQVYTIDSFIHTLVVAYAFHLGISPNFKVETNFYQYLEYSLEYLIDKAFDDKRIKDLFLKFLDSYLFLENKKSFNPKRDILNIVKIFYEYSRNYYLDFKKNHKTQDILKLVNILTKYVEEFYKLLPKEEVHQNFSNAISKFLDNYKNSSKMIDFDKLSKYFSYDEIPVKKNFVVNQRLNQLWQKIRKLISKICEIYSTNVYNDYIGIYEKVKETLEDITQRQDIVFLEDLNKKINKVISVEEFVPELFIRLATTIKHFLIDEFQDTNVLQWENLVPIISEVLSSNGSLFYVGDKKQSIYRFRGGEAVLFDEVKNYFKNFKQDIKTLNKNRRSREEIVKFNNFIFSKKNLENFCEKVKAKIGEKVNISFKLLDVYSNVEQGYMEEKTGGFVYGELIKDKENYEEIVKKKLLEIVKNLVKEGVDLSDIALLVRKTDESTLVSEWLLEEGFPVESEKTLNVKENSWIKEIISLLKFLNSPLDNLSFASFIIGKIFLTKTGLNFDEIQNFIITKSKIKNVIFYNEFKKQYPEIWEKYFSYLLKISGFLPTYNLLLEIYNTFDLKSNFDFIKNYAFFEHLLELAKKSEEKSSLLSYFIDFLETLPDEELHINAKAEKSIKVLTIHKAKGLEFNIVIIPFLRIDIEVGKHKEITSRFLIDRTKNKLEVVKVNKNIIEFSKKLKNLYEIEFENLLIDELNVLYVAFTRAKDQIYFFVPEESSNLAVYLFPWKEEYVKSGEFCISKNNNQNRSAKTFELEVPLFTDWRKVLIEERIEKEEILNRKKLLQGEILHKILSFLGNLSGKDLLKEIDLAVRKTRGFFKITDEEFELYKKKIYDLVTSKDLKEIYFLEPEVEVFCEQEVVSESKDIRRIDRLIIKKDLIIIVDYKLSYKEKLEEYKKQLNEYEILIKEIYKKPIKKFIVFLDNFELIKV